MTKETTPAEQDHAFIQHGAHPMTDRQPARLATVYREHCEQLVEEAFARHRTALDAVKNANTRHSGLLVQSALLHSARVAAFALSDATTMERTARDMEALR